MTRLKYPKTVTWRNEDTGISTYLEWNKDYGWWERVRELPNRDNLISSGGLWFETSPTQVVKLVNYGGTFNLPHDVARLLRRNGVLVAPEFD